MRSCAIIWLLFVVSCSEKGSVDEPRPVEPAEDVDRDPTVATSPRPATLAGVKAASVAVGSSHACALATDGRVICWGSDLFGALGPGIKGPGPAAVPRIESATEIKIRDNHSCARLSDGELVCWGEKGGFSGDGDRSSDEMVTVAPSGVTSFAVTESYTCWVASGNVSCAGGGVRTAAPPDIPKTTPVDRVVGGLGSLCLRSRDDLSCVGSNFNHMLGIEESSTLASLSPSPRLAGYSQLALGYHHGCGIDNKRRVQCWGARLSGLRGDGGKTNAFPLALPKQKVKVGDKDVAVSKIPESQNVADLGAAYDTQRKDWMTPTFVKDLAGVEELVAGRDHNCARTDRGQVWCWGSNEKGQLGDGTTEDRNVPVLVGGLANVVEIGVSSSVTNVVSCAVRADGSVWCWGDGGDDKLLGPTTSRSPVPVRIAPFGPPAAE